jgi:hypothetical protein
MSSKTCRSEMLILKKSMFFAVPVGLFCFLVAAVGRWMYLATMRYGKIDRVQASDSRLLADVGRLPANDNYWSSLLSRSQS